MSLCEPCEHGRWGAHDTRERRAGQWIFRCPGGRILSDAEALRALLFETDGVTPREGVERLERYLMGVVDDGYWLPASMLEGDKT